MGRGLLVMAVIAVYIAGLVTFGFVQTVLPFTSSTVFTMVAVAGLALVAWVITKIFRS